MDDLAVPLFEETSMVAGNIFSTTEGPSPHAPTCQDAFASRIFGEVSDGLSLLKLSLEF